MDLPDWLASAVDCVLRDMQEPSPLVLTASYGHTPTDDPGWGTLIFEDMGGHEFHVEVPEPSQATSAQLVIRIAEQIPFPVSELEQSWGQARPGCPGHTHGAIPVEHDAAAWWACPSDDRFLAPIGGLGHTRQG
jgi:hypothetical protein